MSSRNRHQRAQADGDAPFLLEEGPGQRTARLEHLLYEEVDRLFRLELTDPRLSGVVCCGIRMSPDLRNARITYGIRGPVPPAREQKVQQAMVHVTPFLRARVAEALSMKRVPDLHFHRDRDAEASMRADAVLARERQKQRKQTPPAPEPADAVEPQPEGDEP